jgi:glucosylceramidase
MSKIDIATASGNASADGNGPLQNAQRRTLLKGGLAALGGSWFSSTCARASAAAVFESKSTQWTLVETARDNGHRLSPVALATIPASTGSATLRLDSRQRLQKMLGFGGALTESSAWVLNKLPPERRTDVLRRYFDPRDGIGYTLARTHIGSCDFSLSTWSLANTPGDYELLDFSLAAMRRWLMPLLHDAQRIAGQDRLKLLATPWSPPAWMKTNNQMDNGGSLRAEYAPTWAQHYVRYIEAMRREERLPIWGLTVQNEPEAAQRWESCLYAPDQEQAFVRDHLGPALQAAGMSDVKLYGWDHNRDSIEKRAAALLGDPATAKYLSGLAVHWYVSDDYAAAQRVLDKYPDKQVLFTEGCIEGGARPGDWSVGERYARNIIGDLSHGVCGWIDWNIALDMRGGPNHVGNFCDAPVLVDTHTGEVHYQSSFYYIGHFSRFVQPGAQRIASSGLDASLHSIAFANPDGSIVAVIANDGDAAQTFNLAHAGVTRACAIPGHGIQTYEIST